MKKNENKMNDEPEFSSISLKLCVGEDLEFVEVNQDEMPGETWDSFESSDFYEHFDTHQANTQSAATSTTKTTKRPRPNGKLMLVLRFSTRIGIQRVVKI